MALKTLIAVLLLACLALAGGRAWAEEPTTSDAPGAAARPAQPDNSGPHLRWVEFSLGGLKVKVNAGGVLALHPDAPFRVLAMRSDSWLDLGLTARIPQMPDVDLSQFHTLTELLGDEVYKTDSLDVAVYKGERLLGKVRIMVRLLPIDWLRLSQNSANLNDKIKYMRRALDLNPDDKLFLESLLDLLVEAKRYQEAAKLLEERTASSEDGELLRRLADMYTRLGEDQKAAATISKLLAAHPDDRALLRRLADLHLKLQHYDQAAVALSRLALVAPTGEEKHTVLLQLADALEKAGKPDEAAKALKEASVLAPRDPEVFRRLYELRLKAGDEKDALKALERASALAPGDRGLRLALAEARYQAGDKAAAAALLEDVLARQPDDMDALLRLSRIYQEIGDKAGLARTYQRLAKLRPEDGVLRYNLGVLWYELEEYPKALAALRRAAELRPGDQEVRDLMLDVLLAMGRWDQVIKTARARLKKGPETALIEKLYQPLSEHRPKDMAKLLDLALAHKPTEAQPYLMRAALALEKDDTATAIAALEKGVKILPNHLPMLWRLAELYQAADEDQKALKTLGRILDQDPSYKDAEERYVTIKTRLLQEKQRLKEAHPEDAAPAAKDVKKDGR